MKQNDPKFTKITKSSNIARTRSVKTSPRLLKSSNDDNHNNINNNIDNNNGRGLGV